MFNEKLLEIRKIQPEDINRIINLAAECNLSFWINQAYLDEIQSPHSIHLTALYKRQIIGFIIARLIIYKNLDSYNNTESRENSPDDFRDFEFEVEAEIYNIAVDEDYRKKGVGKLLLMNLLEIVSNFRRATVWLEVRENNREAISFYISQGFKLVSTRKNYYAEPFEDALVLKLETRRK